MDVVFSNIAKTQAQRRMAEYVKMVAGLLNKELDEIVSKYGLVIENEIPQDLKVLSQKNTTTNAEVQTEEDFQVLISVNTQSQKS